MNPTAPPDQIDDQDPQAVRAWAEKLDVSEEQIREALQVVGALAADVELHLKGTRATTNADRIGKSGV